MPDDQIIDGADLSPEDPADLMATMGRGPRTTHCPTCNCADDEKAAQPSTSSEWARRAALEAAAQAVRDAKMRGDR